MKRFSLAICLLFSLNTFAYSSAEPEDYDAPTWMDEFDPFAPNAEEILQEYDKYYEQETGKSSHLEDLAPQSLLENTVGCYRISCAVWAHVNRGSQTMRLYKNGSLVGKFPTSTGVAGRGTPAFDKHPDGRIYDRYTSTKFPGGNYNGLGNMPYAVFIRGGFAIHGTPKGNWKLLGQRASHGCIRIHPDYARKFNRMVRAAGISNTWITVD